MKINISHKQTSALDAYILKNPDQSQRSDSSPNLSLLRWQIVPKLQPTQTCCQKPFDKGYRSVQEYDYVLDFEHHQDETHESRQYRAKFSFQRPFRCYNSGHLRAARVTAWTYVAYDGKSYPTSLNYPFPHFPANAEAVYLELWVSSVNSLRINIFFII